MAKGTPSLETRRLSASKGKTRKTFLEKKEALALAVSIAGTQEVKSANKAEKHHQAQLGQPQHDHKPRSSASKDKLKETKAMIAAERARSKKEKAKLRKLMSPEVSKDNKQELGDVNSPKKPQKSVSFA